VSWLNSAIAGLLPWVPKPLVWQISRRYIAGESLESALLTIEGLNARGIRATLDLLGEDVLDPAQVEASVSIYRQALSEIEARQLDSGVSVKLSEMGLRIDPEACRETMSALAAEAATRGVFVRIDMEDSSVTEATLDLYRFLRRQHRAVGAVIQACLKRSPADIERLLSEGIAHVRLCKGIYIEPPEIAHRETPAIHAAYRSLLEQLVAGGAENVAIATHHPALIEDALGIIRRHALDRSRYEFQMLLGVAEGLRDQLAADGHPVRVYVPFGEHWLAYSTRRLRENPAVAGHVMRNLFSPR